VLPLPTSVTLHGREVPVRVLEGFGDLDRSARSSLELLLSDPEDLDRRCRAALLDPPLRFEEGAVELYMSHHLEQTKLSPELATAGVEAFLQAMTVSSIWTAGADDEE